MKTNWLVSIIVIYIFLKKKDGNEMLLALMHA